jgi:hypothetical protein
VFPVRYELYVKKFSLYRVNTLPLLSPLIAGFTQICKVISDIAFPHKQTDGHIYLHFLH